MNVKAHMLGNNLAEWEKSSICRQRGLGLMGAPALCWLSDLQKITYPRGLLWGLNELMCEVQVLIQSKCSIVAFTTVYVPGHIGPRVNWSRSLMGSLAWQPSICYEEHKYEINMHICISSLIGYFRLSQSIQGPSGFINPFHLNPEFPPQLLIHILAYWTLHYKPGHDECLFLHLLRRPLSSSPSPSSWVQLLPFPTWASEWIIHQQGSSSQR